MRRREYFVTAQRQVYMYIVAFTISAPQLSASDSSDLWNSCIASVPSQPVKGRPLMFWRGMARIGSYRGARSMLSLRLGGPRWLRSPRWPVGSGVIDRDPLKGPRALASQQASMSTQHRARIVPMRLGGQRVPIRVPGVLRAEEVFPLRAHAALRAWPRAIAAPMSARLSYAEAHSALELLLLELEDRRSAAASLPESLGETLTLHRLGASALPASFKTTNCIESVTALSEEPCAKIDAWKNLNPSPLVACDRGAPHRAEIVTCLSLNIQLN